MSAGFGVYVHWPFCESKCPYCDFNSHVCEGVDQRAWREAYLNELDRYAGETDDQTVTSIFFGGGTPSLMAPETVAAIIERVRTRWTCTDDLEVTAEANPSSAEAALFSAFAEAGINRLSIGVQSFNDDALKFLGRRHTATAALTAIEAAQKAVPRISFDLIYARPGQTAEDWRNELRQALGLAGEHLSVYQLTIERGTAFHRERVGTADEEAAVEMLDITAEELSVAGLPAYEISNHARPGAECRHNLTYWRGGDYVGIGPGAHGRLKSADGTAAVQEIRLPETWLNAVQTKGSGTQKRRAVAQEERAQEVLMMGLRLTRGLSAVDFMAATGAALDTFLDRARVCALQEADFLDFDDAGLRATPEGLKRLDAVLAHLLA